MTLDQWRARYEGLCVEAARLRAERDAARAEAAKLQSLIDLQQTRMDAANTLWQDAHPEKEHLCPDLGDLLAWLIEERAVLKTFRQLDRAALADAQVEAARAVEALRKLSEQVAISAKDSFGTCEEWLDSYRLEAPDECAAYEKAVAVLLWSDLALTWLAQPRSVDRGDGETGGRVSSEQIKHLEEVAKSLEAVGAIQDASMCQRTANELKAERESLARRDGFEDWTSFVTYWTPRIPFCGDIIHWSRSAARTTGER